MDWQYSTFNSRQYYEVNEDLLTDEESDTNFWSVENNIFLN